MSLKKRLPVELEKRIKPCPVDFRRVEALLKRAKKDLSSARLLFEEDLEAAYTLLYNSMLHEGLAYMEASGARPDVKGKHKTVIDYIAHALGKSHESQIQLFDHMRRRRHQLIYEPGPFGCSEKEMREAEATVISFLGLISQKIKAENPQKELEL